MVHRIVYKIIDDNETFFYLFSDDGDEDDDGDDDGEEDDDEEDEEEEEDGEEGEEEEEDSEEEEGSEESGDEEEGKVYIINIRDLAPNLEFCTPDFLISESNVLQSFWKETILLPIFKILVRTLKIHQNLFIYNIITSIQIHVSNPNHVIWRQN